MKAITGTVLMVFLLGMLTLTFNIQTVAAPAGVDWWSMSCHDPNHTGYSTSTAPNTNNTIWSYTTGGIVGSSPAVAAGRVYVGSYDKNVYCLDASTGAYVWSYTAGGSIGSSSPAVGDGKVYVGSWDAKVYAFGSLVWSTDSAGNSKATFDLTDNVYVGGQGFTADTSVTIYLIPDGADALPSNAVASASATTDTTRNLPVTLAWSQPLMIGEYDIWVDENQNGLLDGADVWNSQSIGIYPLYVIPEFFTLTSMLLVPIILAIAVNIHKLRQLKKTIH